MTRTKSELTNWPSWGSRILKLWLQLSGVSGTRCSGSSRFFDPGRLARLEGQRAEYYEWLLTLRPNDRTVSYGCDRYFNKLKK